jgi:tRNA U34 2-thiouridine synthase MnmA/TrmU
MGHYANAKKINNQYFLTKAKDQDKDQTYFLC